MYGSACTIVSTGKIIPIATEFTESKQASEGTASDLGDRLKNCGLGRTHARDRVHARTQVFLALCLRLVLANAKFGRIECHEECFGRSADGEYKYRGIECRQRSTPAFVADTQQAFIETFDEHRDPERVCDVLQERLARLRRGDIPSSVLVTAIRVSKRLEAYNRRSRTTAALGRASWKGLEYAPGESVSFVAVDDEASGAERIKLASEEIDEYDADRYATKLVRAGESVLSPIGWREPEIRSYLADREDASISVYL